jgi:hypothetical protein
MKNKEQVNKEFDEEFPFAILDWRHGQENDGDCTTTDKMKEIKSHISSIRQNDVDELIKFIESKSSLVDFADYGDIPNRPNMIEILSTSDIITHLKSIKEKI